ncbi:dihydrofolate reductase family protein [Actinomadura sp. WMMB 499]|uniref:dihydrofolate reductase family protein n=1 Tax=Actinomadura sp. WMMB 499 TaxID=1219491 RepID=UPI001243FB40|nr:dihydrofolate reductase family protein [Actinomadura sp. WMMB 499]QFG21656.1 dihydrofolate reductase family protein [Actinomadura sp. WMMB 499]
MRKIISSTYVTLDGVIDDPQIWTMPYFGEEAAEYGRELLFSSDALLAGRETYDAFAETWPAMEEQTGDFGARMNSLPHYVVSDSLEKAEWGDSTIIKRADAAAKIAELKKQDGQNILQYGYGVVTETLIEHGLLDELHLWIHPVIVGPDSTSKLLSRNGFGASFELVGTRTFENGVIIATYRPAAK